ncbi:MAG: hypothetical protein AB7F94_04885 [Nitrospira sp.]
MKSMLMAVMAVAVAVTFSAPAFAGEGKKEEKKSGHVVVYGEDKDKKGGKADETFSEKKEEKKGGHADTFGEKKDKGGK